MKYVVPNISQFQAKELGAAITVAPTALRRGGEQRDSPLRF
jgi:hypothetical protein